MDFSNGVMVTVRKVTTAKDQYGDATTDETTRRWGPCAVAPRFATKGDGQTVAPVVIGKTVYGPTIVLDSDDQLVIGGVTYDIDGEPAEWANPFTGWTPGIEVPVKRTAAA